MKRNTLTVVILSISAALLAVACVFLPSRATAEVTVKDRDYSVATTRMMQGGDALFVADNRLGRVVVFTYDPNSRSVQPRAARNLSDLFQGR